MLFILSLRKTRKGKHTSGCNPREKSEGNGGIMKRKFLEDLGLEKETIDKIIDQNSQDIGAYKKKAEEFVDTIRQLQEDVKTRDKQLEELKKAGSVDDLKKQLEDAQEANKKAKEEYDAKLADMKYDAAIEKALADALHPDLMAVKIDKSKLKLKDDGIEGLEEQVKTLKETYKDMFKPAKTGRSPENPEGKPTTITVEQFSKMNYTEKNKLFNENKELYDQLTGGIQNG